MASINNIQPYGYSPVLKANKLSDNDKITVAAPLAAAVPITYFSQDIENVIRNKLPVNPEDYILRKSFDVLPQIPGTGIPDGNLYINCLNLNTKINTLNEQLAIDPNNQALNLAKNVLVEQKASLDPIITPAIITTEYAVKGAFFAAFSFAGALLAPIVATIIVRPIVGIINLITGTRYRFPSVSIRNVGMAGAIGFGIGGAVKGGLLGAFAGPVGIAIGAVAGLAIGTLFGWLGGLIGGALLKPFC